MSLPTDWGMWRDYARTIAAPNLVMNMPQHTADDILHAYRQVKWAKEAIRGDNSLILNEIGKWDYW